MIKGVCTLAYLAATLFLIPSAQAQESKFGGWYPNEHMDIQELAGKKYQRYKGVTPEGYEYVIYPDGAQLRTGQQSWGMSCKIDKMYDTKSCDIKVGDRVWIDLIFTDLKDAIWICIYNEKYRPRRGTMRVDKFPAHETDSDGCSKGSLGSEVASGKSVLVRTDQLEPDGSSEHEISLEGYGKAVDLMKFVSSALSAK